MRHVLKATPFCVFALAGLLVTAGPRLCADDGLPPNAALKYWQAFAQIRPMNDALRDKVIAASTPEGIAQPIDDELAEFVQQEWIGYAMTMLHRGARQPECDWQLDLEEDGVDAQVAHTAKAFEMMHLSSLRARCQFERGRIEEGIDDALATMALGRHLGRDGTMISLIGGYRVERTAIAVLAAYLPKMPRDALPSLRARLEALPPLTPAHVVLRNEKCYMDAFVAEFQLIAEFQRGDKDARLRLCRSWVNSDEEAKALVEALADSDIAKLAAELRELYDEMQQVMSLSEEEMESIHKKQLQSNPLAKAVLSYFPGVRDAEKTHECRQLLLKAAIDVLLRGKDALADYRDPFGDGPFQHTPTADGFELRSKKQFGEKTWLSLRVGVPR